MRVPADVQLETPGLLPQLDAAIRPADIGLDLLPTPAHKHPTPHLAIDVTIAPLDTPTAPPAPPGFPNTPPPKTYWVHEMSARSKFCVPHASALLANGISVLPFTVDHLGGIGCFGCNFLFGSTTNAHVQPAAPKPPWTPANFPRRQDAFLLCKQLENMPTAILPKANQTWRMATNNARYGSTYRTHLPAQWATQALALNMSVALTKHIQEHTRNCLQKTLQQRSITKKTLRRNMPRFSSPPIPFLLPGATFHDIPMPPFESAPDMWETDLPEADAQASTS